MELRQLRYFISVADELHFRRAADRLHIAQPALSKQISSLERDLGVRLLERTRREVRLTEAGEIFLEEARQVLAQAEQATERVRGASRGETGVLEIGFIAPAIYEVLPRVFRRYCVRYPNVRLALHELNNHVAIQEVLAGRLHAAFVRLPIEDKGLRCDTVLDEPVVLALPDNHRLTEYREVALTDVADEAFVMIPRSQEPALYDYYIALCLNAGFSPKVVHEVDRTQVAIGLVAGRAGLAFVPASATRMPCPGVVYRHLAEPAPRFRLGAVWSGEDTSHVLASFIEARPWRDGDPDGEEPLSPELLVAAAPPGTEECRCRTDRI
ncbi:LysR substrate-binding domain-containing protein [Allosalinactinospora lopnorensis]|uniref:LysR substrate-binding domain-containing protein n=1 Tax=Allosalinactinospora lopnorensis TaxID=1352348 RepID=UPI000696D2B5|nr:LysR substrate-binding domain-containing protein [Allosalinactinospora lopnorensis]